MTSEEFGVALIVRRDTGAAISTCGGRPQAAIRGFPLDSVFRSVADKIVPEVIRRREGHRAYKAP